MYLYYVYIYIWSYYVYIYKNIVYIYIDMCMYLFIQTRRFPSVSCNSFDKSGKPTGSGSALYVTTRFYMPPVVLASSFWKSAEGSMWASWTLASHPLNLQCFSARAGWRYTNAIWNRCVCATWHRQWKVWSFHLKFAHWSPGTSICIAHSSASSLQHPAFEQKKMFGPFWATDSIHGWALLRHQRLLSTSP